MDGKQLQSLKAHTETLSRFIIRLSKFYEGMSGDIDAELQTLRGHLAGSPNFTLATVSINKLNTKLQSAGDAADDLIHKALSDLERDVKRFQQALAADPVVQQTAAQLLVKLHQPAGDLFATLALYQRASQFYASGVKKSQDAEDVVSTPVPASKSAHYEAILEELNLLIENYSLKRPEDIQLAQLKARLLHGMSEDELLKSCVLIIRMIVQEAMSEASLSGKVIQSLHKSLGQINENVSQTIDISKASFDARKAANIQLKAQLDTIEDAVKQSESLEKLKHQAQDYVKSLASTLSKREQADQDEQHELMKLLASMQSQLTHLQTQTQNYRKKLAEQILSSQTDALTRLPNRQAYNERVERAFELFESRQLPLAIAVVDIDYFKSINDRFGHAAGDKTLQVVGRHFRRKLGKEDFIARWGGEEFVMLLPGLSPLELFVKLDELRDSLARTPFKFKQEKVTITASFGATCLKPGDTPDEAFNRADKYLYQAKHDGRNCVVTDQDEVL